MQPTLNDTIRPWRHIPRKPASGFSDHDIAGLTRLYSAMPAERRREFWAMRTSTIEKMAFLLRWGSFEVGVRQ